MKKIVLVLPTLPNYRKEFLNRLSERLLENGVEIQVYHGFTKKKAIKKIEDKKFESIAFETHEYSLANVTVTFLKGLKQRIIEEKPDGIIMLFNPAVISFVDVLLVCMKLRIPYAIWSCGFVRPDLNGTLVRIREKFLDFFDKRATAHIAYHTTRKLYLENKGIKGNRVFVAQNTIDTESILSSYDIVDVNSRRFNRRLNVLFVGALIKGKCLKEAMSAIDSLISSGLEISFTIIGGGSILEDLNQYCSTLTNKSDIHILGPKYGDDLKYYFLSSDLFLLSGSGGLAINEAMAYGLPVISTNGDGTVKDLIDGNGFMLEKNGDEKEIKELVARFYELNRSEKVLMSEQSINIIKNKVTLSLMVDNYYNSIMFMLEPHL